MAAQELRECIWSDADLGQIPRSDTFINGIGFESEKPLLDFAFCSYAPDTAKSEVADE